MKFLCGLGVTVKDLISWIQLGLMHTVVWSLVASVCGLVATVSSLVSIIIFVRSGASNTKAIIVTLPGFLLVGVNDSDLSS